MAKQILSYSIDHHIEQRTLSRSFETLEKAQRFAEGKSVTDIYKSNGRFKVEWKKVNRVDYDENGFPMKEEK